MAASAFFELLQRVRQPNPLLLISRIPETDGYPGLGFKVNESETIDIFQLHSCTNEGQQGHTGGFRQRLLETVSGIEVWAVDISSIGPSSWPLRSSSESTNKNASATAPDVICLFPRNLTRIVPTPGTVDFRKKKAA